MLKSGEDGPDDYEQKFFIRWARKLFRVDPRITGPAFFIRGGDARAVMAARLAGQRPAKAPLVATPLFLALIAIEASDIIFAFDSVPAVIAVTQDPALVYSAMIFAILGLRSLYFVIAALTRYLVHLEKAVIAVLVFIALKLGAAAIGELAFGAHWTLDPMASLGIVLVFLAAGVAASVVFPGKERAA